MFWFKKQAKDKESEIETEVESDDTLDINEADGVQEIGALSFDESEDICEAEGEEEPVEEAIPDLTVKISSLDGMADFMNSRRGDGIQLMRRDTFEAFEIRERHLRLARVWGSVSMARECSAEEYAMIMLALEFIQAPEKYYVLPLPEEKLFKAKIEEFCEQKYNLNGKKYSKATEKFVHLLTENGDVEEWKAFSKELMFDIALEFCDKNGVDFSLAEDVCHE